METLLVGTRTLTNRVLEFFFGTRIAPVRGQASDSHLHWDRVVRAWKIVS